MSKTTSDFIAVYEMSGIKSIGMSKFRANNHVLSRVSRTDFPSQTGFVPSDKGEQMVLRAAQLLRQRREKLNASLSDLSRASDLDRAGLKRAETCERIPSLSFWIDWADALGTSLEEVLGESRKAVGKTAGEPPERRRLGGE